MALTEQTTGPIKVREETAELREHPVREVDRQDLPCAAGRLEGHGAAAGSNNLENPPLKQPSWVHSHRAARKILLQIVRRILDCFTRIPMILIAAHTFRLPFKGVHNASIDL